MGVKLGHAKFQRSARRPFLGRPLSCKLKGSTLCYGCRPSVCNGCIVAKRCEMGLGYY